MQDVAEMERRILAGLQWKLHPPTAAAFAVLLLDYLMVDLPFNELEDLYSNASFFAELSVCDYFFVTHRCSTIALACVLNALEGMMLDEELIVLDKAQLLGLPKRDLLAARTRLWELYERSEERALHHELRPLRPPVTVQSSPTHFGPVVVSPVSSPVSVTSERCKTTDYWPNVKQLRNGSW
jgi:hypothetical protein